MGTDEEMNEKGGGGGNRKVMEGGRQQLAVTKRENDHTFNKFPSAAAMMRSQLINCTTDPDTPPLSLCLH